MAVLKSDDERVTFYLTPLAVEFEDEEPRWLEYELGFRVGLDQGADLLAGSEGLSLSLMESELTELITRLTRLLESLPEGAGEPAGTVRFEGTDPDFALRVTAERRQAGEEGEGEGRGALPVHIRAEVWMDLACFQRTTSARGAGRAQAGLQFHTSVAKLESFTAELKQDYERSAAQEFVLRQEPPLSGDLPFSRILNLLNRKDWSHRHQAVRLLEELGDARSITLLIQALADPNGWVRERAGVGLTKLTGETFAFDAFAPPSDRQRAINQWQSWWQAHRLSYAAPRSGSEQERRPRD